MKQYDLKAKPTATGGPSPTLTQVMSGQIDVGWSAPPFGLDQLDEKQDPHHRERQRRRRVQGPDGAPADRQRADAARTRKAVVDRYMKAYRETIDCMYSDPAALKVYADWLGITEAKAKRTRDDFFPRPRDRSGQDRRARHDREGRGRAQVHARRR